MGSLRMQIATRNKEVSATNDPAPTTRPNNPRTAKKRVTPAWNRQRKKNPEKARELEADGEGHLLMKIVLRRVPVPQVGSQESTFYS